MNFRNTFEHVTNRHDYPHLPEVNCPHHCGRHILWGFILASCHLLSPPIIALQYGMHIVRAHQGKVSASPKNSCIHYLGLLMCIFDDWLEVAKWYSILPALHWLQSFWCDQQAKQAMFKPWTNCTETFKDDFKKWEDYCTPVFGYTSIQSKNYLNAAIFACATPPFVMWWYEGSG